MTTLGRVTAIWRYPVKSMRGEPLDEADVHWNGIRGDRRFAFVRPGLERSDFPWLTIREHPAMWGHAPRLLDLMGSRTVEAMGGWDARRFRPNLVDPDTGERDMRILKQLGRERDACLGVYGATVTPGVVRVGDLVSLPPVAR